MIHNLIFVISFLLFGGFNFFFWSQIDSRICVIWRKNIIFDFRKRKLFFFFWSQIDSQGFGPFSVDLAELANFQIWLCQILIAVQSRFASQILNACNHSQDDSQAKTRKNENDHSYSEGESKIRIYLTKLSKPTLCTIFLILLTFL